MSDRSENYQTQNFYPQITQITQIRQQTVKLNDRRPDS
jgi:hypothetical protein